MEEKRAISRAVSNLMAEARSHGLHPGALKDVVKAKLMNRKQAEAHNDAFASYLEALGRLAAPEPAPAQTTTKPRARA